MKIKLIIVLSFLTNILLGQAYITAEFLKIKGTHCTGLCCAFDKTYFFLCDNQVIKRLDVSNYDNHSLLGSYTCKEGKIKMTFSELFGGIGIGNKTPSMHGCITFDNTFYYILFCFF